MNNATIPPIDESVNKLDVDGPSESDKAWFAAHPQRAHRLRREMPHEWPGPAVAHRYTIIRQFEAGARLRLPIGLIKPAPRFLHDESFAHLLFDKAAVQ